MPKSLVGRAKALHRARQTALSPPERRATFVLPRSGPRLAPGATSASLARRTPSGGALGCVRPSGRTSFPPSQTAPVRRGCDCYFPSPPASAFPPSGASPKSARASSRVLMPAETRMFSVCACCSGSTASSPTQTNSRSGWLR